MTPTVRTPRPARPPGWPPALALLLCALTARADTPHVVRTGETFESLAPTPQEAAALRAKNRYAPNAQPLPGDILLLPGGEDVPGLVVQLSGTGTMTPIGGAPAALREDLAVPTGARVCTDADSYATLRLAVSDDSTSHDEVTLLGQTCLILTGATRLGHARASTLDLEQGGVLLPDATDPGAVTVRTPDGVTASRAGGVRVSREEAATRTEAVTGHASVFGAGVEVRLNPGQGSRVRKGFAPEDPNAHPPPGQPALPADGAYLRRPDFSWTPAPDVVGYRLEIAADPGFTDLVWVKVMSSTTWTPDRLTLPFRVPGLWWRIVSIDRLGFYGAPSEAWQVLLPGGIGP